MPDSVYKVIELVGTSEASWEEAAKNAVEKAAESLRELRVAEITKLDMKVENAKVVAFRARVESRYRGRPQACPHEVLLHSQADVRQGM